ncbi:MAG: TA system VapC family ribonuclease toxin [Acidobacteriota bacterium]
MKKASSKSVLLDVNVLLALAWPHHVFHRKAQARMSRVEGWATCAATQLGFLRLSLNPRIVDTQIGVSDALALLGEMVSDTHHRYLETMPSPIGADAAFAAVLGHNQLQDVYLVWLAELHHSVLLTFDTRLSAYPHVEVLA